MRYFIRLKEKQTSLLKLLPILLLPVFNASCADKNEPDQQTLHFVTRDGIKTSLDLEHEIYIADNNRTLFYINFWYYTQNKNGQWTISKKPDGPWQDVPDQGAIPENLLKMSTTGTAVPLNNKH